MASITIDCIEIEGIIKPYLLHDLRLDIIPNDHGYATLILEIKEDGKAENLMQSLDNQLITIESKAKANTGVLFKGYVAGVTISPQIDKVMAEIRLVTATIQMDRKRELFLLEERNEIHGDPVGNGRKRRGCLQLYRR